MGLGLEVGLLKDLRENDPEGAEELRSELARANALLRHAGLPDHVEPENGTLEVRDWEMYGYSGLHYLRRVAARLDSEGTLGGPGDESADADPVLAAYYRDVEAWLSRPGLLGRLRRRSAPARPAFLHLMAHSDAEGLYVPVDFADPLIAPREGEIAGDILCSSQALVRELAQLAEVLEIPPGLDPDDDRLWNAIDSSGGADGETWQWYGVESFTCQRLLCAARYSVETGAALAFV
jgi:hypothetical protein